MFDTKETHRCACIVWEQFTTGHVFCLYDFSPFQPAASGESLFAVAIFIVNLSAVYFLNDLLASFSQ